MHLKTAVLLCCSWSTLASSGCDGKVARGLSHEQLLSIAETHATSEAGWRNSYADPNFVILDGKVLIAVFKDKDSYLASDSEQVASMLVVVDLETHRVSRASMGID